MNSRVTISGFCHQRGLQFNAYFVILVIQLLSLAVTAGNPISNALPLEVDQNQKSPESAAWNFDSKKEEDWLLNEHNQGRDDENFKMSATIIQIISYIVIGLVLVSFFAFLLCLCCPVCMLAKMRQRRQRGQVFSRPREPATSQTGGLTTGTTVASHQALPPIIAISNNQRANAPYPVQQSVTLVPLITPQAPGTYMHTAGPAPRCDTTQNMSDLPPPYPGLHREVDTNPGSMSQPAYNPYYVGPSAKQ